MKNLDAALLLFANSSFYKAFSTRDMNAMGALWSSEQPVFCLHPGWPALYGRSDVIASWARILGNPQAPQIVVYGAHVLRYGDVATVVCYEQLADGVCIASNGFVIEHEALRIVWHQSGPCQSPPANDDTPPVWQ